MWVAAQASVRMRTQASLHASRPEVTARKASAANGLRLAAKARATSARRASSQTPASPLEKPEHGASGVARVKTTPATDAPTTKTPTPTAIRAPAGRRYFVIMDAGHATTMRGMLPTQRARDTYEVVDTTSNKFSLAAFEL